ncbi:MAG: VWA domain-containing protein [Peptostreptococcaceae bacterium]|nr:VWA domain-containing protein [Peptostreptococcaceae bacterium]
MRKGRNLFTMFMITILLLTGCGGKEQSAQSADKEQKEKVTTEQEQNNEKQKEDLKDDTDGSEEDFQSRTGLFSKHPMPVYDYKSVVNYPKGLLASDGEYEYLSNEMEEIKPYLDRFEKIEKASDEQADQIFTQLLYLVAADYKGAADLREYGYIIFKNDKTHPITGQSLLEDVQINIELVLDASGSMAKEIDGKSMMDIAKESIVQILDSLPENANVGLRVYGHKGNNTKAGKAESCNSSELIHPIEQLNVAAIKEKLAPITSTGWTPIAKSIELGAKDFEKFQDKKDLNIMYIISDGIESCDGDPIQAATNVRNLGVKPIMGIVGFNVNPAQELQLRQIAEAAGGYYATTNTAQSLVTELQRIHELANSKYDWKKLEETDVLRVSNAHTFAGNYTPANDLTMTLYKEADNLRKMQRYLREQNIIDFDTYDKLDKRINDRMDNLLKLEAEFFKSREAETQRIRAEYMKRLGEDSFVVINE